MEEEVVQKMNCGWMFQISFKKGFLQIFAMDEFVKHPVFFLIDLLIGWFFHLLVVTRKYANTIVFTRGYFFQQFLNKNDPSYLI